MKIIFRFLLIKLIFLNSNNNVYFISERHTRAGWRVREARKINILARLQEQTAEIISGKTPWVARHRGNWRGRRGRDSGQGKINLLHTHAYIIFTI